MQLQRLLLASQAAAATASRREKTALLAACLREATPEDVPIAVAYLSGSPRQAKLGVAYAALAQLTAAAAATPALTVHEVDAALDQLSKVQGKGSAALRTRLLTELLSRATETEQDFLKRLVLGELRQGALEGVMLDAIAEAYGLPASALRRAAMFAGDLGQVAQLARERGEAGLSELRLQLFRPLLPMLAQTATDVGDAFAQLGSPMLEHKLDGARVHVHRQGEVVRVYSRLRNDVTAAVPELVESALALAAQSFVLDGEAIALRSDGRPHPFQTTMRRFGRKLDVHTLRAELPLSAFYFDLLHLDGEDLLDRPARERVQRLDALLPVAQRVARSVPPNVASAEEFMEQALSRGHEGLMAKNPDAAYEAGRRGGAWLKIKRAHTLDLVVLAVEWGSGRRKGWLSNLHLGARDPNGGFVMLGKTFKGMTDEMLAWQTQKLLALETRRDAYTVYVRPELVVEVAFDGVQTSSQYPGGVALRFARVKAYREDKRAEDADTIDTVRAFRAS
ncbi:MAG TPA: ATP-dependent DNA ligase [Polyangiales bacterium]|nr:ATP-dependent DNA ligase [Polyangiales bacterium]